MARILRLLAALSSYSGLFLLSFLTLPGIGRADVWGYIDERGVAHFATSKLDARYELFFRNSQSFNTKDGIPRPSATPTAQAAPELEIPRPVAVPAGAAKLIAFFEVSNNFKAVRHLIRDAAATHALDFELLQALISAESGFDPQAVSPKGAIGLMQLMPATAQRMGVRAPAGVTLERRLTDPATNIAAGARYLRQLMNLFPGRLDLALAAYNAGEGAVQRAGNQVPNFKETRDYVQTVTQIYHWLKPPSAVADARKLRARDEQRDVSAQEPQRVVPTRVRMELGGGAWGRGNMVRSVDETPMPMGGNLAQAPGLSQAAPSGGVVTPPLAVASEPSKAR